MASIVSGVTDLVVRQLRFQDMDYSNMVDGIWACASLLHVPKIELNDVFTLFMRALKTGGHWYMSFKFGDGEMLRNGRFFNDQNEESLAKLVEALEKAKLLQTWVTRDARPERQDELWLNALVRRIA